MDFEVVREKLEDFFPIYQTWCQLHGWPSQNIKELDQVFVCYNGSIPIYSCFFWRTPSEFAIIGFPFSNPYSEYKVRVGGISFLFDQMLEIIKKDGFRVIWTTSNTERVREALDEVGFEKADLNVDQYYKRLF